MSLFHRKTPAEKQLDAIIAELQINMANNYKDTACEAFKLLTETFAQLKESGGLPEKVRGYYEDTLADYAKKMVGYSHNAQKPYRTREDMM